MNYLNLIDQIPLFHQLSTESKLFLSDHGFRKSLEKGEILFLEREPCLGICFVINGQIKVYKQGDTSRQQTIRFFKAGESFNEIAFLEDIKNIVSAVALESSAVLVLPSKAIGEVLRNEPDFAQAAIKHLVGRIGYLSALVQDLSLKSVRGRLAEFLIKKGEQNGGVIDKRDWYTQDELGARLGTVTDVIQRTLRHFEKSGFIQTNRLQIRIVDSDGLVSLIR